MTYTEQTLTCRDCGQAFAFTAGEQEFYAARGLTNTPGRCPSCRAARKAGGSYGGGRSSDRGGYSDRAPREMHEARCDSCGGVARVPFVPRGDKPVYCSDCFSRSRDNSRY
ncbi:MAG TPA: zinc-ribbon domain containing protein [Chloroflexota bacterium]|nr:zinc-ribbon domain containing protein [Chloroflexota bacterium]